MNDHEKLTKKH